MKKATKNQPETDILKNQLARMMADYDNLRKRTEAQQDLWIKFSTEKVLIKLFPVLDMLESAQKHLNDQGLAIAIGEFKKVLGEEGIEEILPKKDELFDPQEQEAVDTIGGGKKGHIAHLILPGWKFSDQTKDLGVKIIRPAKVRVYGQKSNSNEEAKKEVLSGDWA